MAAQNISNYVEPMEMENESWSSQFVISEEETSFHAKSPPNKKSYKSLEEGFKAVGLYAARERFAIIKKSTSKDLYGKVRSCVISCDRGGIPTSPRSKKTDCRFHLSLSRRETDGQEEWSILFDESKSLHNHPRLKEKVGHTVEHRLSQKQYQKVCQMEENKKSREDILHFLKSTYPEKKFTYLHVHNAIHKYKRKLSLCNEFFKYIKYRRCDDYLCEKVGGPRSTNFIFANKKSIELLGKTNKAGILAIHSSYESDIFGGTIIEVTHLNGCFVEMPFCAIYMTSNTQNKYTLAVKSIKSLCLRSCAPAFIITQENAILMDAIKSHIPKATNLIDRSFINAMFSRRILKPILSQSSPSFSDMSIMDTWNKLADESCTLGDLKVRFQNFAQNLGEITVEVWIERVRDHIGVKFCP
jgi:hypothetical protein